MNDQGLKKIELELNLNLPKIYIDVMRAYPFKEDAGSTDWSIWDVPEAVIRWTKEYQSGYGPNPCWNNNLICIGDDGDACPYAYNILDDSVVKTYKGNIELEPLERYQSFISFVEKLKIDYEEPDY